MAGTLVMEEQDERDAQEAPSPPEAPPAPPAPPKRSGFPGWLYLVIAALLLLPIIAGFAILLLWEPYAKRVVIENARNNGVEINPERVDLKWDLSEATLENTSFRLIGVSGIQGSVEKLHVKLDNKNPSAFDLQGMKVKVVGSAPQITVEISEWTNRYPQGFSVPMQASGIDLEWRGNEAEAPWLKIAQGSVRPDGTSGVFEAQNVNLSGLDTGHLSVSWTGELASVQIHFGAKAEANATPPVSLTVVHTPGKTTGAYNPYAEIKITELPLDRLSGALVAPIPPGGVKLSLSSRIEFESDMLGGPIQGQLSSTLLGFVPPKPPELSHYDFGNSTEFSTRFSVSSERQLVSLSETQVKVGSFKLKGDGEVQRQPDHARILLKLTGNLPCADLAAAAVQRELENTVLGGLGKIAGNLTKQILKGSVGVTLAIDADSRALADAKVATLIGVGCGLKPLALPDLSAFGELGNIPLPEGLPKDLAKALPSSFPKLPALPSGLPDPAKSFPNPFGAQSGSQEKKTEKNSTKNVNPEEP